MAVEVACAGCGPSLDAGARFCKRCGEPVVAVSSRAKSTGRPVLPARERTIATLLFADIGGFTELILQSVAELDYHSLLGPLPETRWITVGMVAT
jgi:hypothetical protein